MSYLDDKLSAIDSKMLEMEAEKLILIEKAMRSTDPASMIRASMEINRLFKEPDAKSYLYDMSDLSGKNFQEKPTDMSYDVLRQMAATPIVRAIVGTRQAQILNFSTISSDEQSVGWRIRKRRRLFDTRTDKDLTYDEKARIEYITEFIERCGRPDSDYVYSGDNFQTFLQKLVKDSLEIDQSTFEIVQDRRGRISNFFATDGATFRFASKSWMNMSEEDRPLKINGRYPEYVQLYEDRVFADFYDWELSMGIRNKSTDSKLNGYGIAELEDLARIVTWMLNGDQYNGKFFSQGAAPKGILALKGAVNQNSLLAFKNMWQSMVAGVQNAWKTPVIEGDNVNWIDLQKSNQDMQFAQWGEYLVRTSCAVFKIDPMEVGLVITGSAGSGGAQYSSVNQKINYSKDKGLYPMLQHIQERMNIFVVRRLDPDYEFVWTGLNPQDESALLDMDAKRISNFETVNEVRLRRGLSPIDDGDIILNSIMQQERAQKMMGNPESNQAVDNMMNEDPSADQSSQEYTDFDPMAQQGDGIEASVGRMFSKGKVNPMVDELNKWIQSGMPKTMDLSSIYLRGGR